MTNKKQSSYNQLLETAGLTEAELQQVLSGVVKKRVDYADLYLQDIYVESWMLEEGIIKNAGYQTDRGIGIRVIVDEKTGLAYSNELNLSAIKQAAKAACSISPKISNQIMSPLYLISVPLRYQPVNPFHSLSELDKVSLLQQIDQFVRKYDARITQVVASLNGSYETMLVMASDGTLAADVRPMVRLNVQVIAENQGRRESGYSGGGGRYDYSFIQKHAMEYAQKAAREALLNLESKPSPAGVMPVILGSGWPGILLHEAIGHGLEADFNRKKTSMFSGRLGEKVASSLCTVIDDGTWPNQRGSLNIDDEGTPTQKTILIENGILKNYLFDKFNARLMKMKSTGNARRESYQSLPLPRMTNTYLLAGSQDSDEMIHSVKKGLYAVNFAGGQVDITSGNFVFTTSEAYLIENGKIAYPVKNATLIGNGMQVLNKISMVGQHLELDSGIGICGKDGQSVPVCVGQPMLKIDTLTVGGTHS